MTQLEKFETLPDAALHYIMRDAHEAAVAMRSIGDDKAECKYLDQVNDAATVLYRRRAATMHSQRKV